MLFFLYFLTMFEIINAKKFQYIFDCLSICLLLIFNKTMIVNISNLMHSFIEITDILIFRKKLLKFLQFDKHLCVSRYITY